MKFIEKKPTNEPKEVLEKRVTPGSTFDDLPKEPLRNALLKEQGFICAYCMQRIKNTGKSTKIEHWSPRSKSNEKDYMNLLAVCKGNEGKPGAEHCDTLKKSQPITISPLMETCEKLVNFNPGGFADSEDETIKHELENILGLNKQHLVDERAKMMDWVKDAIQKVAKNNTDSKLKKSDLAAMLKEWQTPRNGKFQPFCQVAINYVNKKIARLH